MTSAPQARSRSMRSGFECRLLDAGAACIRGRLAVLAVTLGGEGGFGLFRADTAVEGIRPEPGFQPVPAASGAS